MRHVLYAVLLTALGLTGFSSKAQASDDYTVLAWTRSFVSDLVIDYGREKGFLGPHVRVEFVNELAPHLVQSASGRPVFTTWFRAPMRDENLVLVAALTRSNHYVMVLRTGATLRSIGSVNATLSGVSVVVSSCESVRTPKWVSPSTAFVFQRFDAKNEELEKAGLPTVSWFCGTREQYEAEVVAGTQTRNDHVMYLVPVSGGSVTRTTAILNGSVDSGVVSAPAHVRLVAEGKAQVLEAELGSAQIDIGLVTSRSFYASAEGNAAVKHFCAGYARTIAHFAANPDEAKAYIKGPLGLSEEDRKAELDAIYDAAVENAQPSCFVSDEQMRAMERMFGAPIPYDFSVVRGS